MRIRKTREWLNSYAPGGRADATTTRTLRLMLSMVVQNRWDHSHRAKIKRVHAGINSRAAFVGAYHSQHKRTTVIFS
jgi:hypothetical protein